jgi:ssDNA-binding Zn-finger/Zn-ribbon topoisomerase 1
VQQQKVPFGVDPKTVLCVFFKAGSCLKGDKCKFSHDPNVERKAAKINIYEDQRTLNKEEDSMENWDESKLSEVVTKKHGPGIRTTTELVCHHFLDAIEQRKYGWFWECPNGEACKYRHCLPPDFVLRRKGDAKAGDEREEISLEDFLESERYKIAKSTPVTAESFAKWKEDRKAKQVAEEKAAAKKREAEIKSGRYNLLSGRDLFTYQPDLFTGGDDDEAMDVDYTQREEEQEEQPVNASVFLDESLENLEIEDDDE